MDPSAASDLGQWMEIQSDAYGGTDWGPAEFRRFVLDHPHVEVRHTWFAMDADQAVGVASAGVFRRNPEVGVGHMLAVRSAWRGRGVGMHLALHRYHALAAEGIRVFESETTPHHPASIRLHFACGFRPKTRLDPWNSADETNAVRRFIARRALERLYRRWRREHPA